ARFVPRVGALYSPPYDASETLPRRRRAAPAGPAPLRLIDGRRRRQRSVDLPAAGGHHHTAAAALMHAAGVVAGHGQGALAGADRCGGSAAAGTAADGARLLPAGAARTAGWDRTRAACARHRLAGVQLWRPGGRLDAVLVAIRGAAAARRVRSGRQLPLEAAATLRASPWNRFFTVATP